MIQDILSSAAVGSDLAKHVERFAAAFHREMNAQGIHSRVADLEMIVTRVGPDEIIRFRKKGSQEPVVAARVICEKCEWQGLKSTVREGGGGSTLLPLDRFYDGDGKLHIHNPNMGTIEYRCSEGHCWTEKLNPACWCGWPDEEEAERLREKNAKVGIPILGKITPEERERIRKGPPGNPCADTFLKNGIKVLSVKDFRAGGFLQEVNRCFLHPLGLALSVEIDLTKGEMVLGPIWNYLDDPEGLIFHESCLKDEDFSENVAYVAELAREKARVRKEKLGYIIQPAE